MFRSSTEALKAGLELIVPAVASGITFSATGKKNYAACSLHAAYYFWRTDLHEIGLLWSVYTCPILRTIPCRICIHRA
jgi:hypothetical protein